MQPRILWAFPLLLGLATTARATVQEPDPARHGVGVPVVPPTSIPLYQNLGTYSRAITTSSPTAKQYFDQGFRFVYAFNHEEAINSFHAALAHDSACAMCWWGVAYALGPNINAPMDTSAVRPAYAAIQRAKQLASTTAPSEQSLITATAARYSAEPVTNRAPLDSAYANALRTLAGQYQNDPDVQTLYAEAIMNLAPWNYWTDRGRTARPGTDDVVAALERTIAAYPDHPGACHYYIHAVEASTTPARAVPCAHRLARLMPGAGHLVHMPSHIYMRTGRYDLVAAHNHDAIREDERFIQDRRPTGFYQFMYYPHNYHMMWAGLMMLGRANETLEASRKIVSVVPLDVVRGVPQLEYFMPTPYFSLVRFQRWDEMLAEPAPNNNLQYTTGMWHYTRGLAHAARGRANDAKAEQAKLVAIASAIPANQPAGINGAQALLGVANQHLAAKIALLAKDTAAAVAAMKRGITAEDSLLYDEPPAWYHPLRQELGWLYIAAQQPAQAEQVFQEDLAYWPENGWSLEGLAKSLHMQNKHAEATTVETRLQRAWRKKVEPPKHP